jgi:biotin transporter BioY
MERAVNWNKIVWLALLLFVAQVVVGLAEGVFSSADSGTTWLLAGHAASFIACSTIFALFATRNPPRPFAHTLLALVLQAILSVVFSGALAIWLGSMPWSWVSVAMEWAVLVAALVAGTSVGIRLRHSARRPADA